MSLLSEQLSDLTWEPERTLLDARIAAFPEPQRVAASAPKEAKAKWLLASCLQKAIRQGDSQGAQQAMDAMLTHERAYALHRMAVIVLEDIGVANLPLVRDFLFSGIRKAWFEERGARRAALYFADAFARSPKDRSACDLPLLAATLGANTLHNAFSAEASRTVAVATDRTRDLRLRALAFWSLLGTSKIKSDALPAKPHDAQAFLQAHEAMGAPVALLWVLDQALTIQREWHPVALGLLAAQAQQEGFALPSEFAFPPLTPAMPTPATHSELLASTRTAGGSEPGAAPLGATTHEATVGGLLFASRHEQGLNLSGLDGHCGEGRGALREWLSKESRLRNSAPFRGRSSDVAQALAGSLLFSFEGGRVANPLSYPSAATIQASMRTRSAKRVGIDPADWGAAGRLLGQCLPSLDAARRRVLRRNCPWIFQGAPLFEPSMDAPLFARESEPSLPSLVGGSTAEPVRTSEALPRVPGSESPSLEFADKDSSSLRRPTP